MEDHYHSDMKARYDDLCARMEKAAAKRGRRFQDIRFVAVSKKVHAQRIIEAAGLGITDFGENYFQEAREKITTLEGKLTWHFIGHLQKNKAHQVLELFNLIQSVDSVDLAERLAKRAQERGKAAEVLLQVHYGDEATKHGFLTDEVMPSMERISCLTHLKVKGLMTIPPFLEDPEENRRYFRDMALLSEKLRGFPGYEAVHLSMGMTDDFEIAIEEGSTMVRIGRALFGERI
ncbi:MAG: YggS family pyridoxal phosphate-dependent enzyme [Candidatus Eremiobacteraeota bacterium]|nr:YggS family pyridoxal phosphate-dependent enzyme [Candidatus Eremiobacteraeota bacterium]